MRDRHKKALAVTLDHQLLQELASLRFLEAHHNVLILGPVGVGKTHLASGLGHIACGRGHSVFFLRTEALLKELRASRRCDNINPLTRVVPCLWLTPGPFLVANDSQLWNFSHSAFLYAW